ncbi:MAG: hypothetical protein GXP63_02435 [DPANN group archaeon]|nr:hypothetical protein [DPANN group archaeon]
MGFTKCHNCNNKVPVGGQCNGCGFVHGLMRPPSDSEFLQARKINENHAYEQFRNIDMLVLEHEQKLRR